MTAFLSGHRLEKALSTIPQSTFVEGASHLHGSRVGENLLVSKGRTKRILVTSPDCGSSPRGKKKKLLGCPGKQLSHGAQRECGRQGRRMGHRRTKHHRETLLCLASPHRSSILKRWRMKHKPDVLTPNPL